jgi:adenylate cyclase
VPVQPIERKLAAIFAADIAGYSRLMARDEVGTLARLKACRVIVDELIASHRGRIFNTAGDSVVADFASAVEAVQCAVAVQTAIATENAGGTAGDDELMLFRIGVHVGDVMVDGENLLGDGVNIAARLEALAEPGAICVSAAARDYIGNKLPIAFDDLGLQQVKNIAQAVRVYRVQMEKPAASSRTTSLPLPDKPSIAVLPFANMSGDPEQDYFADGMVEEITAALCRVRDFFVIARNSAFSYKGRTVPTQQMSRELGVRYLIEGSVRRGGDRVRITAQLIDGPSGNHLWADKYDGAVADIFDLQDRITESVVGAIQPSVRSAEIERARRKRPESLDAYDFILRAYPSIWSLERTANVEALKLLSQAIAIEPGYPLALSLAAWCHAQQVVYNWAADPEGARAEALRLAQMATAAGGEDDPTILTVLGAAHTIVGNHASAARLLEKALSLDPNSSWAWNRSGWLQNYLDHPEVAIEHFERALRLSPFDPMSFNIFVGISGAHFVAGRYRDAALWAEKGLLERPGATWVYRNLVGIYARLGREADARAGLARLLNEYPDLTVSKVVSALVYSQPTLDRVAEGLRKAGMPEE